MRVLQLVDYSREYRGNFIDNLTALDACLLERGHQSHYVFPPPAARTTWIEGFASRACFCPTRIRGLLKVLLAIVRHRPHVVLCQFGGYELAGALSRTVRPHIRVVWFVRSGRHNYRSRVLQSVIDGVKGRIASHLVSLILVPYGELREELLSRGWNAAKGIAVAENPIDYLRFDVPDEATVARLRDQLGVPRDALLLLHVGGDRPVKNAGSLLSIMRSLPGHVRLIEVADLTQELADAIRSNGVGERVIVMPPQDVLPVLQACDVVVNAQLVLGRANIISEGMACGKLVVEPVCDPGLALPGVFGYRLGRMGSLEAAIRRAVGSANSRMLRESNRASVASGVLPQAWARRMVTLLETL